MDGIVLAEHAVRTLSSGLAVRTLRIAVGILPDESVRLQMLDVAGTHEGWVDVLESRDFEPRGVGALRACAEVAHAWNKRTHEGLGATELLCRVRDAKDYNPEEQV